MGIFATYAVYKAGQRKGRRQVDTSAEQLLEELSETCDHCGFMRMQHSQDGRATCPTYTN